MTCQLCNHDVLDTVSSKDAKTKETLIVVMCNACGFVQQQDIPDEQALKQYYHDDYRQDYKGLYTPKNKHVYRAGKVAIARLNFLKSAGVNGGRILDVGAGGGEFTCLAGMFGFSASGVEPNKGYSEYARNEYGCDITTGDLDNLSRQVSGQYDVITLFHVLEHLPNPQQAFEKLYGLLREEGHALIEVPWIETNDASPHNIYFKAHLYYFSVDTLIAAASPYFDAIMIDISGNLKILFRAKQMPSKLHLPDASSVVSIKKRMRNKGWLEYLLQGGGLLKPFKRLLSRLEERKARHCSPRQILDQLYTSSINQYPFTVRYKATVAKTSLHMKSHV
ncbi:class I SAM-dependent methyltransferase [Endozoicomonas ascidiicola]|uniref:class I SAM-dependent methyltransferase n=1 Tax=Endozoicomonas ascidiicola TaxID=1698521 RepID=UPI0008361228|nr:class I SAM-dependent methyltransferase [Endozoicomonas ascidiicola]